MKKIEIWDFVLYSPFTDYFKISNLGRVKSLKREILTKRGYIIYKQENILKPRANEVNPHLSVTLTVMIDGVKHSKTAYVHKMVGMCFIVNKDNKSFVSHKNNDYNNNMVNNLVWTNQSEINMMKMNKYPHLRNQLKRINIKNGYYKKMGTKFTKKEIDDIIDKRNNGSTYQKIADIYGVSLSKIWNTVMDYTNYR